MILGRCLRYFVLPFLGYCSAESCSAADTHRNLLDRVLSTCFLTGGECNIAHRRSTRRSGGTAHEGGGCDQLVGSTVSNAIVLNWLWSTEPRSSPLGYFSRLLQVDDN